MKSKEEIQEEIRYLQTEMEEWKKARDKSATGDYDLSSIRLCEAQINVRNEKIRSLRWAIGELKEGEK